MLTDEELVNRARAIIQEEAKAAFISAGGWGAEFMATGTGKSKVAIDIAASLCNGRVFATDMPKMLLVVPTEKLRDQNWAEEFEKWGHPDIYNKYLERTCYASLHKYENEDFDFIILDEGHNITEGNSVFFKQNIVRRCLLLTATKPKDPVKIAILKELKLYDPIYELTLDEAIELGFVAPYDITIVEMQLDNTDKYIKAGSKAKPFMNTEQAHYNYLTRVAPRLPAGMGFIKRMQFIYNLKSKTEAAKYLLENVIPQDKRTLIFCGSKKQANEVSPYRYYSKPTPPKKLEKPTAAKVAKFEQQTIEYQEALTQWQGDTYLNLFKSLDVNRLACCEALNEGHNIDMLDIGFIIQLNSNENDLIQRLGRILRYRPGHRGKFVIVIAKGTVDEKWCEKTMAKLNPASITRVELSRIKMGIETISFN